jgi:hypothetical protein
MSVNVSLRSEKRISVSWRGHIVNGVPIGDIYEPKCCVDLSFNSRLILDFFLFWSCKLQNSQKHLGLINQIFTIHAKNCS